MKNKEIVIAAGGTGGHVFPALSLYDNLKKEKYNVTLTSDLRGLKFIDKSKNLNLKIIDTTNFSNRNYFTSSCKIIYAIIKSFFLITKIKPQLIFGMGGYASLPICFSAILLKKPFVIYENNLILGKVNKFLLPYAKKIFLAYEITERIPNKYKNKIFYTGNILRQEILDLKNETKADNKKLNILVLGGSQAAKIFGEKLPEIFIKLKENEVNFKLYQQCIISQKDNLKKVYDDKKIHNELFNFSFDIKNYYKVADLAISRAGSSALSELLHCKIPIIAIPLKSAADNHQEKNANYFEKKGYCVNIDEDEINIKLFNFINLAYKDKSILENIKKKQNYHNDKFALDNINNEIKYLL